jgi:hypothetical protein
MKIKWHTLVLMALTGFSNIVASKAVSGKIIINNQSYSSGSSNSIQGSGQVVTVRRMLGAFNKLSIGTTVDVEYFAAENNAVEDYRIELTADDNIVPIIDSRISGGTLTIDANQSYSTWRKLGAKIYGPAMLQGVSVEGSADLNLQGIAGDLLEINLEGTGNLTAQGKVQQLMIKTSGSRDINTKKLQAEQVTIHVEGSADVKVTANKTLDVVINGISDIIYYGHPETINKTINGIGDVLTGD